MSINVIDFKHIPGENDAEYIELLKNDAERWKRTAQKAVSKIKALSKTPDKSKYDYRYDHTDCIWYRDSRSRCPVTCAQYRDGWNDAMQYIFCDGKGYSPYVREERKQ